MKKVPFLTFGSIATVLASLVAYGYAQPEQPVNPKNVQQQSVSSSEQPDILKLSEAFGNFIGRNLNSPGIKFDLESVIKGMRDGAAGKPAPMSDHDYEAMMAKVQEKAFNQMAEENLKAANEFMAKNAKEKGVVEVVPGKLEYIIIQEGKGATVEAHSSPSIEYTGKYLDGTVFGSSQDSGGPITIPLDQTIPGFSKGIVGMKEGEKRRLFVHPEVGYGTSGQLLPNALLIFEVEVVKAPPPDLSRSQEEDLLPLTLDLEVADDDEDDLDLDEEPKEPKK